MLNVAIAVDAAVDPGPDAARVVSAACEEVIGVQRCPVARELGPGAVAAWYALVLANEHGPASVRIEFRDRTADGVLIEERVLTFAARDARRSRLASVGSVIAALAAAREGSLAAPPPRKTAEEPPPAALAPPPPPPPAWPRVIPDWGVDLAALASPTFGDGPHRWGGLGRVRWGFAGRALALVSGRYTVNRGDPSFSWWTASAGVGTRLGDSASPFNVELSGELVFEYARVRAERDGQQESLGQSGWGGRGGVEAVWATWRHCSLILGVDGTVVLPRINVVVADQEPIVVPSASLGLFLGLRFQP